MIDKVAKRLLGPRMCITGLIEQKDIAGLGMHAQAQRSIVPTLSHTNVPSPYLRTWWRAATSGFAAAKASMNGPIAIRPPCRPGQTAACSGCSPSRAMTREPRRKDGRGRGQGLREGPDQLRRSGVRHLSAAILRQVDGLFGRDAAASDHRHRDVRKRLQQLPSADARARRRGQARRADRRRLAARVPDDLAWRSVPQPDEPGLPQPDVDGRRGDDPGAADERRRAGRRVRQDRAGAVDGRDLRRSARGAARGRPDDDRPLPRRAPRRVHRLPALLGTVPRGRRERDGDFRGRGQSRDHGRHVRRHGHRQHDGVPRGNAGDEPSRHARRFQRCTPIG